MDHRCWFGLFSHDPTNITHSSFVNLIYESDLFSISILIMHSVTLRVPTTFINQFLFYFCEFLIRSSKSVLVVKSLPLFSFSISYYLQLTSTSFNCTPDFIFCHSYSRLLDQMAFCHSNQVEEVHFACGISTFTQVFFAFIHRNLCMNYINPLRLKCF